MSPREPHRRQHPRVVLVDSAMAQLLPRRDGHVHDWSMGGLRLEHEGLLRPGAACLLRVQLHEQVFTFGGQVVWSEAIGRTGPGRLRFQSGIAFTEIPVAAAPLLAHLLEQASLAG